MTKEFTPLDFLKMDLDRAIEARTASRAELAAEIQKLGIGYSINWLADRMRLEAEGDFAQYIADRIGQEGFSAGELASLYEEKLARETGYIIPSNSDTAFKIYQLQAMQKWIQALRWVEKEERKEEAAAA